MTATSAHPPHSAFSSSRRLTYPIAAGIWGSGGQIIFPAQSNGPVSVWTATGNTLLTTEWVRERSIEGSSQ